MIPPGSQIVPLTGNAALEWKWTQGPCLPLQLPNGHTIPVTREIAGDYGVEWPDPTDPQFREMRFT